MLFPQPNGELAIGYKLEKPEFEDDFRSVPRDVQNEPVRGTKQRLIR